MLLPNWPNDQSYILQVQKENGFNATSSFAPIRLPERTLAFIPIIRTNKIHLTVKRCDALLPLLQSSHSDQMYVLQEVPWLKQTLLLNADITTVSKMLH